MNRTAQFIFLVLVLVAFAGKCRAVDLDRMAAAIAQVEDWQGRRGSHGEFGPTQIMPHVWRSYSLHRYSESEALRITRAHLQWLSENLEHPTPYRIALAWNAGLTRTNRCRVSNRQADYAMRVVNVYEESHK